jgi:hypothetical protein
MVRNKQSVHKLVGIKHKAYLCKLCCCNVEYLCEFCYCNVMLFCCCNFGGDRAIFTRISGGTGPYLCRIPSLFLNAWYRTDQKGLCMVRAMLRHTHGSAHTNNHFWSVLYHATCYPQLKLQLFKYNYIALQSLINSN